MSNKRPSKSPCIGGLPFKKDYKKPEMQVYDVKMTQILCASREPNGYPGPFGYIPGQHEDDEILRA